MPEFWPRKVWPLSSPKCNPLDYFIWSVCERDDNEAPNDTATLLMAKITEVIPTLSRATLAKACMGLWQRIETVVELAAIFLNRLILHVQCTSSKT